MLIPRTGQGSRLRPIAVLLAAIGSPMAAAQGVAPPSRPVEVLPDVVVSASRIEQRSFDVPASIQSVDAETIRSAGAQVNLSEVLSRVPGVAVLNRQNYAQDLQLSIRGFGSRSTFGIRGVRLIVDGIPATMPDGQGQAATISLPSTSRIEVLRGPMALLYGNAAGGVLQAFTADGPATPEGTVAYSRGSYNAERIGLQAGGQSGSVNYLADWSRFSTDGYRDHSAARREQFNTRFRFDLSPATRVTVVANVFDQPLAQDPLGLTRGQMEANPRQVDPVALSQDTRKTISQNQMGVIAEHRFAPDQRLTARVYAGQRAVFQTLATPLAAQTPVTAAGGVVDLDRNYGGIGLQYSHAIRLEGAKLTLVAGVDHDRQHEQRQGFINNAGTVGAIKRDERNRVENTDFYALANLALGNQWTFTAGARSSQVDFRSSDRFIVAGNGDDSGSRKYSATSPVIGISRHFGDQLNVYANVGRGFETPTFAEIAYRTTTGSATGLNLGLNASNSRHAEIGAKLRVGAAHRFDVAVFSIETRDEIVIDGNAGGRSTFKNAGRTLREGAELSYIGRFSNTVNARVALTWLAATYRDAFASGAGAAALQVPAGNQLPGTASRLAFAELVWKPAMQGSLAGLQLAAEAVHVGKIFVNDANADSAAAYTLLNLRAGLAQRVGSWRFSEFVRVDNIADHRYVGSVIVNDGNRRFFEPAPGRTWLLGASATLAF